MNNTYYEKIFYCFEILEYAQENKLFSNQFYEVMYNHGLALLETGSSIDFIKLYEMHRKKFHTYRNEYTLAKFSYGNVLENFKKYLVQEIDKITLNEIAKFLDIYKNDKKFRMFILSKA